MNSQRTLCAFSLAVKKAGCVWGSVDLKETFNRDEKQESRVSLVSHLFLHLARQMMQKWPTVDPAG